MFYCLLILIISSFTLPIAAQELPGKTPIGEELGPGKIKPLVECKYQDIFTNIPKVLSDAPKFSKYGSGLRAMECIIWTIIQALLDLAALVAVFAIVFGGYKYMLASGDPEQQAQGKQIILYAIIGLIVVLLSFAIVKFATNFLGFSPAPFES